MPVDPRPIRGCPVCGRPAEPGSRPFCSPRCRSVDLGRWLGERYAVPGEPVRDDDDGTER